MNPYSFLNPVTESNMFYGYQPELERIVQKVTDRRPISFFVIGGRSMGKTSLLHRVEQCLRGFNIQPSVDDYCQIVIPLYIDILNIDAPLNGFFGTIADKLSLLLATVPLSQDDLMRRRRSLQSVKIGLEPFGSLSEELQELARALSPKRLRVVLLVDNLLRKRHNTDRQDIDSTFIRNLRAFLTHPPLDRLVSAVVTGSHAEYEAIMVPSSPLDNILVLANLHVFDEEQSLAFIHEPTSSKIPLKVAREVYVETGGHPFLLHYMMWELCSHKDWGALTVENVYQATERFNRERKDFQRWWEKLGEADRKIYAVFLREERASVDDLVRMMLTIPGAGGKPQIVMWPMIENSLWILIRMGLIRECPNGLYELAGRWPARMFRRMG